MATDDGGRSGNALTPKLDAIAILLAGLALSLLLKRYAGINHDAVLYLGEGLMRHWPEIFSHDLAFVHGTSQGRFTLFPLLLGVALQRWDPAAIFMWGALASTLLFAAASWNAVRALCEDGSRFWAWLGVTCLPATYGYSVMFKYNEPFLTARPLAESLCLIAIGLIATRRYAMASASILVAGLLHPLQAIAIIPALWCYAVWCDRRWLHLIWIGPALVLLAWPLRGVLPLDPFRTIDPRWLAILKDQTGQLFLLDWPPDSFQVIVLDVIILGHATRRTCAPLAPLCAAAAAGLLLALATSLILVDALHLALPASLQFWRAHWIAHWLAMAMLAILVYQDVRAGDVPRALLLALVLLVTRSMLGYAWIALLGLYLIWPRLVEKQAGRRLKPVLGSLFAFGIATLFASYVLLEWDKFRMAHFRLDLYALDRRLLLFPLVPFGLCLMGHLVWRRFETRARSAAFVLVVLPLLGVAAHRWDARPPTVVALEKKANTPTIFGVALPDNAQVYWAQHGVLGAWLVLNRASYYSPHQIAGQIFNRDLSFESERRTERMTPLILDDMACQDRARPIREREQCRISEESLRVACAPFQSMGPDYLILPYEQLQPALGAWSISDPATGDSIVTWRLYACTDLLGGPAPHAPQAVE